jgi:hypothetical protein
LRFKDSAEFEILANLVFPMASRFSPTFEKPFLASARLDLARFDVLK